MGDQQHTAYIGLGSNLGDRYQNLQQAIALLKSDNVVPCRVSSIYRSAPVGPVLDQPDFFNAVVAAETCLTPLQLLKHCLGIENTMGRVRRVYQGPREVDLDLLFVGELETDNVEITVPHPRYRQRAFVLYPLAELSPNLKDPRDAKSMLACLHALGEDQKIERLDEPHLRCE